MNSFLFYFSLSELFNYTSFIIISVATLAITTYILISYRSIAFYLVCSTVFSIVFHLQGHLMVPMAAKAPAIIITSQAQGEGKGKKEHSIKALSWESLPMTSS